MAHTVLRIPGFFSQLCMLNNGSTQMRSRGLHPFSLWNLNNPHRQVLVPDLKAKHWEIGSSNTASKDTFETNVDCGSFTPMSEARAEYDQTMLEQDSNGIDVMGNNPKQNETLMFSIAPLPYFILAALPGAETIRSVFGPFAELVKTWNLPDWLVHWGHPANMAVVLFAMGGYGSYLGWQIRLSDDVEVKAKAKDLHPKLLGGMFFFFALGATGGITSLLTSDKPILESPHAVTGFIGLGLLTLQTALPALFEGNPGLRNVHGVLGSGIMALFLIHSVLGLQLGLSF